MRLRCWTTEGSLRAYSAELVSGNGFSLLGVNPYLGRLISPATMCVADRRRAGRWY